MLEGFMEQYGEYSQFIIMGVFLLIGAAIYGGYLYYKKQEDMKNVNNNLNNQALLQQQQQHNKPPTQKQEQKQVQKQQPNQPPVFVPSDTFKGEQKGYTFKNGPNGNGYYMDK
jgi:type II secretory pathway pseudopilin PulG